MSVKTADEAYEQIVKALSPAEQRRLAERIIDDLDGGQPQESAGEPCDLLSLGGMAPDLLDGEDAQEWVSRTRREADEHRERQWKRGP